MQPDNIYTRFQFEINVKRRKRRYFYFTYLLSQLLFRLCCCDNMVTFDKETYTWITLVNRRYNYVRFFKEKKLCMFFKLKSNKSLCQVFFLVYFFDFDVGFFVVSCLSKYGCEYVLFLIKSTFLGWCFSVAYLLLSAWLSKQAIHLKPSEGTRPDQRLSWNVVVIYSVQLNSSTVFLFTFTGWWNGVQKLKVSIAFSHLLSFYLFLCRCHATTKYCSYCYTTLVFTSSSTLAKTMCT